MSGDTFQRSPRRPSLLGFNPRPTIMSGDTCQAPCHKHRFLRFNPRPTIMSGDTERHRLLIPFQRVSIHARQLCRAIHAARHGLRNFFQFQSTPDNYVGRYPQPGRSGASIFSFQSTPDNYVGRYDWMASFRLRVFGFNPRPTIMSGDTQTIGIHGMGREVSIHARQLCRAIQQSCRLSEPILQVSIHARQLCRAIPLPSSASTAHFRVSIHARQLCRAIPRLHRALTNKQLMFQSTPDNYVGRYSAR